MHFFGDLAGMGDKKSRQFRFDRLLDQPSRTRAEDLGKRIRNTSRWIGQRGDGSLRHVAYPFLDRELTAF